MPLIPGTKLGQHEVIESTDIPEHGIGGVTIVIFDKNLVRTRFQRTRRHSAASNRN